jgi:rubredoxin
MPYYRYRCTQCGYEYDDLAAMDAPSPECPNLVAQTPGIGADGTCRCSGAMVRVPQMTGTPRVLRGATPTHYPGREHK